VRRYHGYFEGSKVVLSIVPDAAGGLLANVPTNGLLSLLEALSSLHTKRTN
jgi:hypothetical protein